MLAEMAQHQQSRADDRGWIRDVLAGNIRRGAVNGFKHRYLMADVRAWHKAETADESSAEVGDDVAVEIFHQQHVVLVGVHHQLHAGVVDDVLAVGDFGIVLGDVA